MEKIKREIFELTLDEFNLFETEGKLELIKIHGRFIFSVNPSYQRELQLYQLYSFYSELNFVNKSLVNISGFHWENVNKAYVDQINLVDFF